MEAEERRVWAKSVMDLEAQRDLMAAACDLRTRERDAASAERDEARAERDALAQVLSDLLKEQHPKAAERLAPEWFLVHVPVHSVNVETGGTMTWSAESREEP